MKIGMGRKIDKCAWFWDKDTGRVLGYVFNPYLKDAQYCLDNHNAIMNTTRTLKDTKVTFEA